MRFTLRTLIIVMMLGGPLSAWGYQGWRAYRERELHRLATEAERLEVEAEAARRIKAVKSERQLQWGRYPGEAISRALAGDATTKDLDFLKSTGLLSKNDRIFYPDGSFAGYAKR